MLEKAKEHYYINDTFVNYGYLMKNHTMTVDMKNATGTFNVINTTFTISTPD